MNTTRKEHPTGLEAQYQKIAQRAGEMASIMGCSIAVDFWEYCLYPPYTQQESFMLKVRSIPLEDYIYVY